MRFPSVRRVPCFIALLLVICFFSACGTNYDKIANLAAPGETIVCFGDSITRGHGSSRGNDYPARLARLLERPVVNAGSDGDTAEHALRRLDHDVLAHRPRVVVVLLGGNDVLRRNSKEETLENLDRIVARCVRAGAMVVLVHGKYGLFDDPYRAGFEEIAERHKALFVAHVLKGILGNVSRSSDRIHPNDAGYALLTERIAEALIPLLAAADSARG